MNKGTELILALKKKLELYIVCFKLKDFIRAKFGKPVITVIWNIHVFQITFNIMLKKVNNMYLIGFH